jgi:hypothetical protein
MRNLLRILCILFPISVLALALAGCSRAYRENESLPASVQVGSTYYTQVGMFYEKGRYRTTNYGVGIFLPANTAAELVEFGREQFVVKVPNTGETIEYVNVEKYTNWSLAEAFEKLFAREPVSLKEFNAIELEGIESGSLAQGMRKSAVIVARGYPPSHETPSLDRDQWKYWKNRWDTIIVSFKNDRIVEIKD